MTVHFVHIGKTGGTALKRGLRRAGLPETPYGPIELHRHRDHLDALPAADHVFFFVRDPVARFLSGFYSRLRKGQPRYYFEWSPAERKAFEAFPTPHRLATALAARDKDERALAEWSMGRIRHLELMETFVGSPRTLRKELDRVVYIGRQETLDADWQRLKDVLALPASAVLPTGPKVAHRRGGTGEEPLDEASLAALRHWYRRDYELVEFCERVRADRGWPGEREPANLR
jgi:hypothetical protein